VDVGLQSLLLGHGEGDVRGKEEDLVDATQKGAAGIVETETGTRQVDSQRSEP
jgi:hypothetical protein